MDVTRRTLLRSAAGTLAAARMFPMPAGNEGAWLGGVYRELHLDAHFGQLPSPYENFDAERAAQLLSEARFQMVSFFAICNAGYCYFPTKLGVRHPGLRRDYTGEMASALKKRGIRVLAYVSAGPDRHSHTEHPEWMIIRNPSAPPKPAPGEMAQM